MRYYIDTEFCEGKQTKRFCGIPVGKTKPTIDLISLGMISEDGRGLYLISKEFNLWEAWNRFDLDYGHGDQRNLPPKKVFWIRENVLLPIWHQFNFNPGKFSMKHLQAIMDEYGKTNKQIAAEIQDFVMPKRKRAMDAGIDAIIGNIDGDIDFYGYFADYDWVVFCWIFGRMIDLPKGFPLYCRDLKQMLDDKVSGFSNSDFFTKFHVEKEMTLGEKLIEIKKHTQYPKQENNHNALSDAKWNKQFHEFLNTLTYAPSPNRSRIDK